MGGQRYRDGITGFAFASIDSDYIYVQGVDYEVLCGQWKESKKCANKDVLGGWCDSGSIFVADIAKENKLQTADGLCGVTAMDDFLIKFFPKVHERKLHAKEDNYCKYDDQLLQLFISSLYFAALVASFGASKACRIFGRKPTILVASLFFIGGAGFSALAKHKWMLILGRILFGIGVGFGNEAVPVFLSEIAPVQYRGAVNILFQLFVIIGILIVGIVNYFTSTLHPIRWRVSLAIAGVPGLVLFFGSMNLSKAPTSHIERGKDTKGKAALKKIRGLDNVEDEYEEVKRACEIAKEVKQPFKKLMKRSSVPPLVIGIMLQIFQQMTGINVIMFYAQALFQTTGFKNDASLLSAVITGIVNVASTFVSIYLVDKIGRRKLLLQACINWCNSTDSLEYYWDNGQRTRYGYGGAGVLVCYALCMVIGTSWLADS
ncbi:unnamed protein product [Camellia sinensis]